MLFKIVENEKGWKLKNGDIVVVSSICLYKVWYWALGPFLLIHTFLDWNMFLALAQHCQTTMPKIKNEWGCTQGLHAMMWVEDFHSVVRVYTHTLCLRDKHLMLRPLAMTYLSHQYVLSLPTTLLSVCHKRISVLFGFFLFWWYSLGKLPRFSCCCASIKISQVCLFRESSMFVEFPW